MQNTEIISEPITDNEVFVVVDTDTIQQIAESNIGRLLTKEELSKFEDVLVSEGISEIDNFVYRCIQKVVGDEMVDNDERY
jgi:hypothetical protein